VRRVLPEGARPWSREDRTPSFTSGFVALETKGFPQMCRLSPDSLNNGVSHRKGDGPSAIHSWTWAGPGRKAWV
jgi:hypothetical protein